MIILKGALSMSEKPEKNISEEIDAPETVSGTVTVTSDGSAAADGSGKRKRVNRKRILEITKENDMKYRGPFSYRYFKLFGWICIVISQMVIVMGIRVKLVHTDPGIFANEALFSVISSLSLPFLLIANFAILLNGHNRYPRLLLINGGIAAGFIAFYLFLYYHYILYVISPFYGGRAEADTGLNEMLLSDETYHGYVAFNIFLDIFLCTLLLFFADYRPKRFFTGKKIYIFRAFCVIPVLYEATSVIMKILATNHIINIPIALYPFLTNKPPMCFIMFLIMVLYIKRREKIFMKNGKTHEEFREFCKTNTNSWQFSKYFISIIITCSIIDFLVAFILAVIHASNTGISFDDFSNVTPVIEQWGFGETITMIMLIPFMLLFSYTKTHRLKIIDSIIPLAAVILIVIIYIDGIFQLLNGFADLLKDLVIGAASRI